MGACPNGDLGIDRFHCLSHSGVISITKRVCLMSLQVIFVEASCRIHFLFNLLIDNYPVTHRFCHNNRLTRSYFHNLLSADCNVSNLLIIRATMTNNHGHTQYVQGGAEFIGVFVAVKIYNEQ